MFLTAWGCGVIGHAYAVAVPPGTGGEAVRRFRLLTQGAFLAWARRLGLSPEAIREITLIRTTPPKRRVHSGAGSVACRFPSTKMGQVIQAESHTVELPFVYAAEHDPDVLDRSSGAVEHGPLRHLRRGATLRARRHVEYRLA